MFETLAAPILFYSLFQVYNQTPVARTRIARLSWLFRTR